MRMDDTFFFFLVTSVGLKVHSSATSFSIISSYSSLHFSRNCSRAACLACKIVPRVSASSEVSAAGTSLEDLEF